MDYQGPTTRDGIRDLLKTMYNKDSRRTDILLGDEVIGQVVTYGKKDVLKVSKTGLRPTVFNGRVNVNGVRLSLETSSASSLLNALATQIGKELRARRAASPEVPQSDIAAEEPASSPKP